tara:strand:+ start:78 stop:308 length:231 start_codon:yes stop_codon:yes gene_type:complete
MLDKEMANRLGPLVNNPELWVALKEHLNNLRNLELQGLAVATSELELYRKQGKVSSLANLMNLKEQAFEAKQRIEE